MQQADKSIGQRVSEPTPDTFRRVIDLLKRDALILASGAVLGAAIGYGSSYLVHTEWQAAQVVQIGQVFNGSGGVLIEQPADLVTRFQLRSFQNDVIKRLGGSLDPTDPANRLITSTIRAKVLSADLVEVSVNGFTKDEAARELRAALDLLYEAHQRMIDPSLKRLASDLDETNQMLAQAETRSGHLAGAADDRTKGRGDAESSTTDLMLAELINGNNRHLSELRQHQNDVRERLDPERTFVTRNMGVAVTSDAPVSPRRGVFLFAGFVVGVGLALCWALAQSARGVHSGRHTESP
jgi:hypothetical protein